MSRFSTSVFAFLVAWVLDVHIVHAVPLALTPSSAAVVPGDLVNVDVTVSGLGNPPSVGAFDLSVGFDPAKLTATAVIFGPSLGDPLLFEALTDVTFPAPGVVEFAEVSLLSPAQLDALQSPSFLLATLSFTATGSGTSPFIFVGPQIVDDAFGNKIPEPATLMLTATVLLAVGLSRRRPSEAELSATTLYRTLPPRGNPELESLRALLEGDGDALGRAATRKLEVALT